MSMKVSVSIMKPPPGGLTRGGHNARAGLARRRAPAGRACRRAGQSVFVSASSSSETAETGGAGGDDPSSSSSSSSAGAGGNPSDDAKKIFAAMDLAAKELVESANNSKKVTEAGNGSSTRGMILPDGEIIKKTSERLKDEVEETSESNEDDEAADKTTSKKKKDDKSDDNTASSSSSSSSSDDEAKSSSSEAKSSSSEAKNTKEKASTNSSSSSSSSSEKKGESASASEIPQPQTPLPTFETVSTAAFRIRNGIRRTRTSRSEALSELAECNLFLKHEHDLPTGSFKERGARNALLCLTDEQRAKGVTCASAGNHALAVAKHAVDLGITANVVMPTTAPLTKSSRCAKKGANVVLHGETIADAALYAKEHYVEGKGMTYINGFDDPAIIAGAGTVGLELVEDVENLDVIVVPTGGGGLLAGICLAAKTIKPSIRIIAVEAERMPSFSEAIKAGHPVKLKLTGATLADGLAVPCVGPTSLAVAAPLVDECVTVTEKDIAIAVLRLMETEHVVQEGAGAVGVAAVLAGVISDIKGKNVAVPLCGGNIDTTVLGRVIDRALVSDERLARFSVVVSDRPGGIARLTRIVADAGASIKEIEHERAWQQEDLYAVEVILTVEVRGGDHLRELRDTFNEIIVNNDGTIISWGSYRVE